MKKVEMEMMMMKKEMEMNKEMEIEKETRGRKRGRGRESEKKRQRERPKHRHGPPILMLLREPFSRSQSVACAKVQAGAFKALASLARVKKSCSTVRLFGPCFKTGRTRLEKKNACQNGRLWPARTWDVNWRPLNAVSHSCHK